MGTLTFTLTLMILQVSNRMFWKRCSLGLRLPLNNFFICFSKKPHSTGFIFRLWPKWCSQLMDRELGSHIFHVKVALATLRTKENMTNVAVFSHHIASSNYKAAQSMYSVGQIRNSSKCRSKKNAEGSYERTKHSRGQQSSQNQSIQST